jgi:alpha-amylase
MKKSLMFGLSIGALLLSSCNIFPNNNGKETFDFESRYRTFYQILVYSFSDSNGDGVGDFKGISEKIPYLESLGIEGIWLSPIHPSGSYHSYDVIDYYEVKSIYEVDGYTFENLVEDLKAVDIVLILDLIVNHTSSNNLWFYEAQDAYGRDEPNPYINWFNFSKTKSAEHPWGSPGRYYEGIFASNMPDFNFDEPEVREEFIKVGKYWMEKGVAGFRLDAAMHIFTDYSVADKWNGDILEKNIEWWQEFKSEIKKDYPNFYLIGEVWTATPKLERYYQTGIDSMFNFDHAPRAQGQLSATASMSSGFASHQRNIRGFQEQAIESYFLSNHDKPRLASSLSNQNWLKMLGAMTVLAPGNSFIYYGEEVGLKAIGAGTVPDRAYRTPMPWNDDNLTVSGSYGNGAVLTSTTSSGITIENQMLDETSLLAHYQAAVRIKNEHFELKAGFVESVNPGNPLISIHRMTYNNTISLVIHNGSSQAQTYTSPVPMLSVKDSISASLQQASINGNVISLPPYSSTVVTIAV